jgi:hypothetical protein
VNFGELVDMDPETVAETVRQLPPDELGSLAGGLIASLLGSNVKAGKLLGKVAARATKPDVQAKLKQLAEILTRKGR